MTFREGGRLEANVSAIIERDNGEILIGTSGHGIFLLNVTEGRMTARQLPGFVPSYLINQLYEDRNGTLWVITNDKGIYSVDANQRVTHYPSGMPEKRTVQIQSSNKRLHPHSMSFASGTARQDPL